MADQIVANDHEANLAIANAIGLLLSEYDISFSRWRDGELLGGVVYNRFTRSAICMHVAGFVPNWLNRDFLWVAFNYPFVQLKVDRVFALLHSENKGAIEFDLKLGFVVETRIRNVYPDGDQIVMVMERDKCRWLNLKPRHIAPRQEGLINGSI